MTSAGATNSQDTNKRVLVPLAEGFEEMEGIIIIDVLRRAGARVVVAGLTRGEIRASRGTRHLADVYIEDLVDESFDLIVLPGGAGGAKNLEESAAVARILKRMKSEERLIGAICAAPNVLRNLEILGEGDEFTLHPATLADGQGGSYRPERLVHAGKITTSVGPGSAFEFALDLVEQLFGKDVRDKTAAPMQLS